MNIAELFIKRPITTTLLMLGITVFGVMSYRQLAVSDLPTVDFPTIQVQAGLPGASPETMASAVALPLEKQFATIAGLDCGQLDQHPGQHQHHPAVRPQPQHRRRRPGRPGDDRARRPAAAAADAVAAVVPEGQPRRPAGDLPDPAIGDAAALHRQRVRRDDRAAHLDGQRRRAGAAVRRRQLRGARRRRSAAAVGPRHRHRRGRDRHPDRQRQPADRDHLRARPRLHGARQRAADAGRGLRPGGRRLPQRQPGAAARSGPRLRRHRAGQVGELLPGPAQHQPGDPEAAGLERRRRGRRHQDADADLPRAAAAVGPPRRPHRPLGVDPRIGARRQADAGADLRAGRGGDLRLPAQRHRDDHRQRDAAGVDGRHLRDHVPAQLQPGQPVA